MQISTNQCVNEANEIYEMQVEQFFDRLDLRLSVLVAAERLEKFPLILKTLKDVMDSPFEIYVFSIACIQMLRAFQEKGGLQPGKVVDDLTGKEFSTDDIDQLDRFLKHLVRAPGEE